MERNELGQIKKGIWHLIECKQCLEIFSCPDSEVRRGGGKFCSRVCWDKYNKKNPSAKKDKIRKICSNCKKVFYVIPARKETVYCSVECKNEGLKGKKKKKCSEERKKKISNTNKGKKHSFSSRINMSMGQTKEQKFSGFKQKKAKRMRNSVEYKRWRLSVFERDGFECQNCHILLDEHRGKRGVQNR